MVKNYLLKIGSNVNFQFIGIISNENLSYNAAIRNLKRSLLLLIFLAIALPGYSQVTIGTGTAGQVYPFGSSLPYEGSAAIYLSSEAESGTITHLAWYANTASANARPIVIYLKHTSLNAFSPSTWQTQTTGSTLVYSGTLTPVVGWNTVALSTPFDYDTSSGNLMVLFESNFGGPAGNSAVRFSAATGRHMFVRGAAYPVTTNGTINAFRPNIQLTFASAQVPPDCASNMFPANSAANIVRNPTLTWNEAGGQPTEYDIYFGTSPNPPLIANQAGLSYTPQLLLANTQYYWKVVPKNDNGDATGCVMQSFTTGSTIVYCTSFPVSNDNLGLTSIQLGSTTIPNGDVSYATYTDMPVDINQGALSNLQLSFATGKTYDSNVWIDFNDDGDFFDSGELVFQGTSTSDSPTILDASFFVPETVTLGTYRMRIGTADIGQATPNPCYSGPFGVTVDMTVNVILPPPVPPGCPATIFPANASSNVALNPTLVWNASMGNPASYDVYFGNTPSPGFVANVSAAETAFTPASPLLSSTTYYWKIIAKNIYGEAIGCTVRSFTTGTTLEYCTPTYANQCSSLDYINNFTINTLANIASGCNGNANNYILNNQAGSLTTTLERGNAYDASVSLGNRSGNVAIWIDFNKNGSFETSERFANTTLIPAGATRIIPVIIPPAITGGDFRMRVRLIGGFSYSQVDACENAGYGEIEDYTITIAECSAITWYADADSDGYGNNSQTVTQCTQPLGYIAVGGDCDDNNAAVYQNGQLFIDLDGDGFDGGTELVCYGADVPQGYSLTTLGSDCNDSLILYADTDGDGYGAGSPVACGVANNIDCSPSNASAYQSNELYIDRDGDGFDDGTLVICYGSNIPTGYSLTSAGSDCDDDFTTYEDADGDGFGGDILSGCGVPNSSDCDDTMILYADNDGDGFGAGAPTSCGVANNTDCDDNNNLVHQSQTLYVDVDGDGFDGGTSTVCYGSEIPQGYSLTTSGSDCDDTMILYADNDGDGFGAGSPAACGVANNSDCDDNNNSVHQTQTLYVDVDGDGFDGGTSTVCYGSEIPQGYSLTTNGSDCDDTMILYADNDGDGFGAGAPAACGVANNTDCDDNNNSVYQTQTLYVDVDGDGFDDGTSTVCYGSEIPQGYSLTTSGSDCDDTMILYADNDGDGFGAGAPAACGVTNNFDCDDNNNSVHQSQTLYVDVDGDGFDGGTSTVCYGSEIPQGYSLTTNGSDCDDTMILYADNDGDGFGAGAPAACGVANNSDCDDNNNSVHQTQTLYVDVDGDGFDGGTSTVCYGAEIPQGYSLTTNGSDCDDTMILYTDTDGDGYGSGAPSSCGVANNTDCDDNNNSVYQTQTLYVDVDGDGFDGGTSTVCYGSEIPQGYSLTTNGSDCDDTMILYADNDGDGFGAGAPTACGVANNTDCNDNNNSVYQSQTLYVDVDGDGFDGGTSTVCYGSEIPQGYSLTTNGSDCDDTMILYTDGDGDGFGAGAPAACGVANNTDCDDNNNSVYQTQTLYVDVDGDGFDGGTSTVCYGSEIPQGYSSTTNGSDCDDTMILYADNDGDGFGTGSPAACGVANNSDCDDNNNSVYQTQTLYVDMDGDGFDGGTSTVCYGSEIPQGYSLTTNGSDCDDTMILYADNDGDGFGFGAPAACGVSNNSDCDDNNNAVYQSQTLYVDVDGDGFDGGTSTVCYGSEIPQGYSLTTNGSDCDDTVILYVDNDGDGFGAGAPTACGVANNTDCDDNNSGTHQSTVLYIDSDGDGYHGGVQLICFGEEIPDGYTLETLGLDCNDADASVYQQHILYIDMDGDGFDSGTTNLCYGSDMPFGYSLTTSGYDCDDSNATVNPQAEEVLGNGIDENCSGMGDDVLTQVKAMYCGSTVTDLYSPISAYPVANATAYRFAVTNTSSNTVQYVIRSTNWFSFIQLPAFAYGTTYSIAVELQLDGEWMGEFGQACNVSTFNLTEAGAIGIKQCGITITDFYSPLIAHNLPGVTGYKFRVSNLSNPSGVNAVQELTRTANWFSFIDLMSFEFGAEYSIEVSVRINDQYSAFGNPCSVYTVSPGIKQCGTTFSDKYVPVYAHSYPGVSGYRFRVTNQSTASVQVITRNVNWINFNNIADFQVATAYDVEVAYLTNGAYTDYGSVCTIYSVSPSIKQCGDTISDYYAPMIAQSIPGATGYRFRVTNLTTESVQVIIPSSNWINFNHIIDRQSGTAYSIEVSVLMNGVYSGYGAACTVYTAGAAKISGEQELVDLKLNVTASPSPFTDAFNLNLSNATGASVTINIYDMIGKLLEVRTVRPGDIASQSLGSRFPSGVYNVVVTQGASVKSLKVIKR